MKSYRWLTITLLSAIVFLGSSPPAWSSSEKVIRAWQYADEVPNKTNKKSVISRGRAEAAKLAAESTSDTELQKYWRRAAKAWFEASYADEIVESLELGLHRRLGDPLRKAEAAAEDAWELAWALEEIAFKKDNSAWAKSLKAKHSEYNR